jgi:hypothetical protein
MTRFGDPRNKVAAQPAPDPGPLDEVERAMERPKPSSDQGTTLEAGQPSSPFLQSYLAHPSVRSKLQQLADDLDAPYEGNKRRSWDNAPSSRAPKRIVHPEGPTDDLPGLARMVT